MPLSIDAFNKLILVTSPTTDIDSQTLHDFVEDYMATPLGMLTDGAGGFPGQLGDILKPEGKIEDPTNPGVFSQIILILSPEWQIQFFAGSGYTRIFGAKIVGGVADEPFKATGTAGDITVLESPVDGLVVQTGSGVTQQDKDDIEAQIFAHLMENSETFAEQVRLMRAEAAGSIRKAGDVHRVRDAADTKDRITATATADDRDVTATDGT